ncbi:MAG: hypothetical protein NTY03_01440 [Candidatus Bathyarchaeota archaeon]|nr:hypothetical protein [Candidatus Bathyarchaeota archaeon]
MVDLSLLQSISYITGAFGVSIAAIFYILNLRISQRNQQLTLETRQAQLFMSSMFERISSPEFRTADKILGEYKPRTAEDMRKIFDDPEAYAAWDTVWWVYEGLGVLVHEGLVDIRLVARYIGGTYKSIWERWGPAIKAARLGWNHPRMGVESEYLYDRLIEFGEKNLGYHVIDSGYTG